METPQFTAGWGGSRQGLWQNVAGSPLVQVCGQETSLLGFLVEVSGSACTGTEPSAPAGLLVQAGADVFLPLSLSPVPNALPSLCYLAAL